VFPNTTTKTCPICWEAFIATGRQAKTRVYCSPECKRTAAARREVEHTSPIRAFGPPPPAAAPPPAPQLAAQRDCPHCGGPVSIVALLTTPEAARPQIPITAPDGVIALRR
jgi:endogenous inhibitor of DNA gyrase (YacG/DUF329 family)